MTSFGAATLFAVSGAAHLLLFLFALLRIVIAPAVAISDKVTFQARPLARASTPETAALAADQTELNADQPREQPDSPAEARKKQR